MRGGAILTTRGSIGTGQYVTARSTSAGVLRHSTLDTTQASIPTILATIHIRHILATAQDMAQAHDLRIIHSRDQAVVTITTSTAEARTTPRQPRIATTVADHRIIMVAPHIRDRSLQAYTTVTNRTAIRDAMWLNLRTIHATTTIEHV